MYNLGSEAKLVKNQQIQLVVSGTVNLNQYITHPSPFTLHEWHSNYAACWENNYIITCLNDQNYDFHQPGKQNVYFIFVVKNFTIIRMFDFKMLFFS